MPSTVTEPLTARLRVDDVAALREVARRDGVTVSTLVRRLVWACLPLVASRRNTSTD